MMFPKSLNEVKEFVEQLTCEHVKLYNNPDFASAFIGLTHDGRAVYDYDLMVESLIKYEEMTREEAIEFIDYNTFGIDDGKTTPVVIISKYD